jgi:ribosomal protein S25
MDDQLNLLDWQPAPKARRDGPATQKRAARRAAAWTSPQCDAALKAICVAPDGLTRSQVVDRTGIKESSACARLRDMVDGGILVVRGERLGPYGTEQQIYFPTEKGKARAEVLGWHP